MERKNLYNHIPEDAEKAPWLGLTLIAYTPDGDYLAVSDSDIDKRQIVITPAELAASFESRFEVRLVDSWFPLYVVTQKDTSPA